MTIVEAMRTYPTIRTQLSVISTRIRQWHERVRRRRDLACVSARDLRDAGLSLENMDFEMNRPFWQPLSVNRK